MIPDLVEVIRDIVYMVIGQIQVIRVSRIRAQSGRDLIIQGVDGKDLITIKQDGSIIISASENSDVNIVTTGAGKAYYNGVEINTGSGNSGGGTGYVDRIIGSGCQGSAEQPSVVCSPPSNPCEIVITVGKGGVLRIKESA